MTSLTARQHGVREGREGRVEAKEPSGGKRTRETAGIWGCEGCRRRGERRGRGVEGVGQRIWRVRNVSSFFRRRFAQTAASCIKMANIKM